MRGLGANVKTRHAVQAAIYLAQQERWQVVPVSEIAAAIGISPKFLEDILGALRSGGIVLSRRGKEGGYQLARAPMDISALEIVLAVEGPVATPAEGGGGAIARVTAQAFDRALHAAAAVLDTLTLDQLVEEVRRLEAESSTAYMYYL